MKKWNILIIFLVALCLAGFFAYRALDSLSTDTQPPVIRESGEMPEISVTDGKEALLSGLTATDNRDGDVTGSLLVESVRLVDEDGTISVTCAAFDGAGNVAKITRQAKYTDYESPRFSLSWPLLFLQGSNFDVLSIVSAQDGLDGDIQHRIRATSLDETSISTTGTHQVQFRVSNSLGDTASLTLPVEVYPTGTYNMGLSLSSYLVYLDTGSSFDARSYLTSATVNLETVSLKNNTPFNYSVKITQAVDTATSGVYPVDYLVTYTVADSLKPENSQVYTGFTRLIVVVEG